MDPKVPASVGSRPDSSSTDLSIDPVLRRRFREAADEDGFLPFDRYVEIALYDPGKGFYDRAATRFGRVGDFYTASQVHGLFGATLAAHFREVWSSLGSPRPFRVVEVGPGDGTLSEDLRTALLRAPSVGEGWDFTLVERSSTLQTAIAARLGPPESTAIPWRFAPSIAAIGPFRGLLFANELLDAFPFRRFQKTPAGWAELGVRVPTVGAVSPMVRPAEAVSSPPDLPANAPVGTVLEVSPTMEAWIRELGDHLLAGRVVLIDYGEEEEALLRKGEAGTLEAIREHRPVDPLSHPGTADLSVWVNFTRVRNAARKAGFQETFYGPVSEALVRWGIDDVRRGLEAGTDPVEAVKLQLAMKSFLFGFGSFKVLELAPAGHST